LHRSANRPFDFTIEKLQQKVARRGINYSLERLNNALLALNSPHLNLPTTIHIAGTNGKGSVAHYLTKALNECGKKTLTYTSPHILSYTERFKLNGHPISIDTFSTLFELVKHADMTDELSEYECLTLMAFKLAQQESSDVLILETGLGGRLDATNVVPSSLAIITDIGLDHTDILGHNLSDIATEKAGIIKSNTHVFTHLDHPTDVLETIKLKAKAEHATVHWAQPKADVHARNKSLAKSVLNHLFEDDEQHLDALLTNISPPFGRLTPTTYQQTPCIMDVGHNLSAIMAILNSGMTISECIIGIQKTKDYMPIISTLQAHNIPLKLCSFDSTMAVTHNDLPIDIAIRIPTWEPGMTIKEGTLFFGSFYFIDYLLGDNHD
jgi:folylpolyglutamate synthase/dihydropteroate synthase